MVQIPLKILLKIIGKIFVKNCALNEQRTPVTVICRPPKLHRETFD